MRDAAKLGYLFPLMAALSFGSTPVLIRKGLTHAPALVGVTLALFCASVIFLPLALRGSRKVDGLQKRGVIFMLLAGLASAGGSIFNYLALSRAPVVLVAPLTSIYPLVTLLCAHLFLKRQERITRRIVAGAALVVAGVATITVGKALS